MLTHEDKQRLEEAREYYKDEKYSEALIIFMDLMLASPTNGLLFFDIAKTYLKMGQPAVGMANFEKSLKFLDKVHHYDLQKEFAGMLYGMNRHQEAVNVYQSVTANAVNEEDFVTGIKYLIKTEEIDQAELLLVKNIARFPNSFDTACETAEVEPFIIERLRNRKRSILQALKDNFQTKIEDISKELDFIIAQSEENAYQHLLTDWDGALDDFDDANTIDQVIAAKERLNSISTIILSESKKIKEQKATNAISELRQNNRSKIRELNELETDLLALLPQLPATSLKTEIPSFLNVVKNFKKKTRSENYLVANRAFTNIDNLLSEGKDYKQDGKAAIEKIAAMQVPTEKGVAKRNVFVAKKSKTRRKKEDDTVIVLDSQLKKRKKGNRKVLIFFLLAVVIGGAAAYFLHFADSDKNKRVLLTNVFLREGASGDTEKVREDSYKRGEKLELIRDNGDWSFLEAPDGNLGYMRSEYLGKVHEHKFIEGMFANPETAALFGSARHQKALLAFYKKNEWASNAPLKVEKKVYGHTENVFREIRQIHGKEAENRFNGGIINKVTYNPDIYPKKDMACIIRGYENEEIAFFAFREDNSFELVGHETLEGLGHQMEFIDASTDNRDWFLGTVHIGEKVYKKLTQNSILVQLGNGCARLYTYDRAEDSMIGYYQGSCN
jgi:tetratricopeptide (TPR) repeat protein